jgi:putative acetyltransferase
MLLRLATPADASDIRAVHLHAFETSAEADLVDRLDRDGDTRISMLCVDGDRVVGHVLFSRMVAEMEGGQIDALGLAPVAVVQDRRRRGIASALIEAGIAEARRLGADIIFVLGDAQFYGRFGFDQEAARPFSCVYGAPHFQALVLNERLGSATSGRAAYAPAFDAL